MGDYETDRRWSNRFLPRLRQIAGYYLLAVADEDEDQQRNTDLIVLCASAQRIACRVRQQKYYRLYGGEFTIRTSRASGAATELAKIMTGWGDYLLYAFADGDGEDAKGLIAWHWVDLAAFRSWCETSLRLDGHLPGRPLGNRDGASGFMAFSAHGCPNVRSYDPRAKGGC